MATVASAGTTVVFSALTVAVSMCGLFVFGVPLLTSFGIAGLAVVLLCMSAAVTLLPATLAVVGRRVKPLPPDTGRRGSLLPARPLGAGRPVAVGTAVSGLLILLALPFLSAHFENGDARTLPRSSEARATALVLADRFPALGTDPVTVIADVDPDRPRSRRVDRRHRRARRRGRQLASDPTHPQASPSSTSSRPAPPGCRLRPPWSKRSAATPGLRHPGRWTGSRACRREGHGSARACRSPHWSSASRPCCCCSS